MFAGKWAQGKRSATDIDEVCALDNHEVKKINAAIEV